MNHFSNPLEITLGPNNMCPWQTQNSIRPAVLMQPLFCGVSYQLILLDLPTFPITIILINTWNVIETDMQLRASMHVR